MRIDTRRLGAAVKKRRAELGLNQQEVAAAISIEGRRVTQSRISELENGRAPVPDAETYFLICRWLEVDAGTFAEEAVAA